jgi:hypothetical protein
MGPTALFHPNEGVLRIVIGFKYPSPRLGLNLRTLVATSSQFFLSSFAILPYVFRRLSARPCVFLFYVVYRLLTLTSFQHFVFSLLTNHMSKSISGTAWFVTEKLVIIQGYSK